MRRLHGKRPSLCMGGILPHAIIYYTEVGHGWVPFWYIDDIAFKKFCAAGMVLKLLIIEAIYHL